MVNSGMLFRKLPAKVLDARTAARRAAVDFLYIPWLWLGAEGPLVNWKEQKNLTVFEASGTEVYSTYMRKNFDYFNTQYDREILKR